VEELRKFMKPRHATAIALFIVWELVLNQSGTAVPKDCHCGQFGAQMAYPSGGEFKTKAQCEEAAKEFKSDFYMKAARHGDDVLDRPETECDAEGQN